MLIEALVFSLRKKKLKIYCQKCVFGSSPREGCLTRAGWEKSIIFHTLVVGTVYLVFIYCICRLLLSVHLGWMANLPLSIGLPLTTSSNDLCKILVQQRPKYRCLLKNNLYQMNVAKYLEHSNCDNSRYIPLLPFINVKSRASKKVNPV